MTTPKWSPQIARAMHEFSNAAPPAPMPSSIRDRRQPLPSRQPRVAVSLAAAGIAIAGVIGLTSTLNTTSSPDPATTTQPMVENSVPLANDAVLLPDATTPGIEVVSNQTFGPLAEVRGAVLAPDQTVFGFTLRRPSGDARDDSGETRIVAGLGVTAIADGSAQAEIYRTIYGSCATLVVTTAEEDAWSDNTIALLAATSLDGSTVAIDLPAGWDDLGSSPARSQRIVELNVDSEGEIVRVVIQQMAGVPAAWFLSAPESAPWAAFDLDGSTAWLVEGATTPGYNSIVGERDGIAFAVSGMLSVDEITEIARGLRAAQDSNATPGESLTVEPSSSQSEGCDEQPTLSITPFKQLTPAAQSDALSDDFVSIDEYEAAFSRFVVCAEQRGGLVRVNSTDELTGEIRYETGGELLAIGQIGGSVENECYQEHFAQTEVVYSTTNPQVLSNLEAEQMQFFNETIRPCLESVGVEIPDDLVFGSEEWIRLLDENTKAHRAGNCGGMPSD